MKNSEEKSPLEFAVLCVNEQYFCHWDTAITSQNIEFLNGIDPKFFENQVDILYKRMATKKYQQQAALAIRSLYSQALETLFTFLFAFVQSPYCPQGWIVNCKNSELDNMIKKIQKGVKIPSPWLFSPQSWINISDQVHKSLVLEDKEKESEIKKNFGILWSKFATEFVRKDFHDEYNSIKHGLRLRSGGYYLVFRHKSSEDESQINHVLASSDFGSSYGIKIGIPEKKNHFYIKKVNRNWDPENMTYGIKFASQSIGNIISALKVFLGVNPSDVRFSWPSDLSSFDKPWANSNGGCIFSTASFILKIESERVHGFSSSELRDLYERGVYIKRVP